MFPCVFFFYIMNVTIVPAISSIFIYNCNRGSLGWAAFLFIFFDSLSLGRSATFVQNERVCGFGVDMTLGSIYLLFFFLCVCLLSRYLGYV